MGARLCRALGTTPERIVALRSENSPLACLYHWEKTRPDVVHFTQPVGGGRVVNYTWRQILGEVRRIAAHLVSLNLPPGSHIALLGKNSAHWIMADWAIWMAGHVTVPVYPTSSAETVRYILTHGDSKLLFVGKLDDWTTMKLGVPNDDANHLAPPRACRRGADGTSSR